VSCQLVKLQASSFKVALLPLFTMVDERPQTTKESKGIGKRLKQLIRLGSPGAPHSQSSSPLPSASTPGGDMSFAIVSSGVQLINPLHASSSTLQQGSFSELKCSARHTGHRTPPAASTQPQPHGTSIATSIFPSCTFTPCNSSQGTIDSFSETPTEQEIPKSAYLSTAKDILGVASSFTQMLLKKAPDAVDGNPVKIAFGIAKIILQIKDVCYCSSHQCSTDFASQEVKDNLDVVERRILSTASQLLVVQEALDSWKPGNAEETHRGIFERYSMSLLWENFDD